MELAARFLLGVFFLLFGLGLAMGYVVVLTNWTLGPLMDAARSTPTPTSFQLSDLLWLMVQLQVVMALVAWAVPADMPSHFRVWAVVLLGLPMALIWYGCLHAVAQAGIRHTLRRGAAFIVLLPGTVLTLITVPLLLLAWLSAVGNDDSLQRADELAWASFQLALGVLAALALRWLAVWTVSKPAP